MAKEEENSGKSGWKASEPTTRMAQIMGVEFQSHNRWQTAPSGKSLQRKRA